MTTDGEKEYYMAVLDVQNLNDCLVDLAGRPRCETSMQIIVHDAVLRSFSMNMGNSIENVERYCMVEYRPDSFGILICLDGDLKCDVALPILVQAVSMIQHNMCYELMLLTGGYVTKGRVKEILVRKFKSDLPAVFVDTDVYLDQFYHLYGYEGNIGWNFIANMENNGLLRTHEEDGYKYIQYVEWDVGGGVCAINDPGREPSFKERVSQIMRLYNNCGKLEGIVLKRLDWLSRECDKPVVPIDSTK